MERICKIGIVLTLLFALWPAFAQARTRLNDLGHDTGRAVGNIGHGVGRVANDSGHVVVHGTGRIVKTITHGFGHLIKGH